MQANNSLITGSERVLGTLYADTIKGLTNYTIPSTLTDIATTDTVDVAFGKLLKQINNINTLINNADSNKIDALSEVYNFLTNVALNLTLTGLLSGYVKTTTDLEISGVKTFKSLVYINLDQDVSTNLSGSLIIGNKAGVNIGIDGNEIEARNNNAVSTLYLNYDGATSTVRIGNSTVGGTTTPIYVNNGILTAGTALGTMAYKDAGAYLPLTGGTLTGDVIFANSAGGDSPRLIFRRVKENDGTYDWDQYVTGGDLKFRHNDDKGWHDILTLQKSNNTNVSIFNTALTVSGAVNITGSGSFAEGIRLHTVSGLSSIWFNCTNNSGYDKGSFGITQDSTGLRFRYGTDTSPADRVKILNNGNVGICTVSPSDPLHVYGVLRQSNSVSGTYTLTTNSTTQTVSGDRYLRIYQTGGNGSGTTALASATVNNITSYCDYVTDSNYHRFNKHLIANASETVNGSLSVNGTSTLRGEVRIGSTAAGPNYISFYGTTGDAPGSYTHTFIGERIWGSSERSELLLFKGNDTNTTATSTGSGADRIRHIAAAHLFQIYKSALAGTFSDIGASEVPVNVLEVNQSGILVTGSIAKSGGTSALFLKADGSVDSNTYLTSQLALANYVTLNSALTISATKTFSAQQAFTKTGASPFTVSSNTVVSNLNADLLDGLHSSDFIKLTAPRFQLYQLGTYTKILEFTTESANDIDACISFTWHPSECARDIWADFQFEVRQRSNSSFKAIWKGGYKRNLWATSNDGDTWSIWVEGNKSSYDPYGVILVTSTWSIQSYNLSVSYSDATPSGTYMVTCSSPTLPHSISGNANTASKLTTVSKTAWGQTYWTSGGVPDNISGNILNTGHITSLKTHTYNIGSSTNVYERVYTRFIDTDSGYDLRFSTAGTLRMHIKSADGNVGIATDAPADKLHVNNGATRISNALSATYTNTSTNTATSVTGSRYTRIYNSASATSGTKTNPTITDITTYANFDTDATYFKFNKSVSDLIVRTDYSHGGIKVGNAYVNSLSNQLLLLNATTIRFGGDSWDWNVWAGLKYDHSNKTIFLGLADGQTFSANTAQSGGKLYLPGITEAGLYNYDSVNKTYVLDKFLTYKSNLTTVTFTNKAITKDWMDIGISGNNYIANDGTYIVQVRISQSGSTGGLTTTNMIYSGIMSWFSSATNDNDFDEVVLHGSGKILALRIYLKVVLTTSSLKLLIAASTEFTASTIEFKFKQII